MDKTIIVNDVSILLQELSKTMEVVGTDKLIEILRYSRKNNRTIDEEKIKKAFVIIQIVCDEFNMSLPDIFSSKRKNNRRTAIGICSFLLQKEMQLDTADVSYILKKPEPSISLYKKEILVLNERHPTDKQILNKLDNIITKLNKNK